MSDALEQASLIMVPSGYEDGRLGSLKPLDGSGDFTFSRGSNLSATRVGPNGYIEKGYENLLSQSNTFDTTWDSASTANVTPNQQGYDGSNNAWKLISTDRTSTRIAQTISANNLNTISIYAKAAEWNYVGLYAAGVNKGVMWSLVDGSVAERIVTLPDIYSDGESIGNGWWRFSMTYNSSSTDVRIYTSSVPLYNGAGGDGVSGIYIQDAMLNQGLVAYPYIETTTAPVAGGILEDMPRLDWSGSCPSLLLEPSRTNLVKQSEAIQLLNWNTNTFEYDNAQINPEGYNGVVKTNYTSGTIFTYSMSGLSAGQKVSYSMFAKSSANANFELGNGATGAERAIFNIASGDLVSQGANVDSAYSEDYGNGWKRFIVNITFSDVFSNGNSYAGFRWYGVGEYVYLWGWQLEQDATYPTSYIPTYGVSQTRLNDYFKVINQEGLFGTNKGTFFMEFSFNENNKYIGIGDTYLSDKVTIGLNASGTNQIRSLIRNNGVNINLQGSGTTLGETIKACVSYGSSGFNLFMNGNLEASNATPSNLSQFSDLIPNVDVRDLSTSTISGNIKQILVFPTALSDSECIALTTIT